MLFIYLLEKELFILKKYEMLQVKKIKGLVEKILHLGKVKQNNTFSFCVRVSASKYYFILQVPLQDSIWKVYSSIRNWYLVQRG